MKYETSAGGVIIKSNNNQIEVLLLKDKNGNWTFPKGLIENGENREKTAVREIGEEVGITDLKLLTSLTPIEYFYKWEGNLVKKKVYYYVFQTRGKETPKPQREEGVMEVKWFSLEEAEKVIGYSKTNKPLLKEVGKYV